VALPDAEGNTPATSETLDLDDGIGVVEVERRWAESDAGLFVERDDGSGVGVAVSTTDRVELADLSAVEPADPRGLTPESDLNPWVSTFTGEQLRRYGLDPDQAHPTLLAWGTVGAYRSAALVGMTFPSGATGMWLATYDPRNPDAGSVHIELPFGPAGTDLLDRVVAVGEGGGLVVSAPDGVRADVLDASGALLESLPMVDGAGTWPLSDPEAAASVRIVDEAGDTVAELPIEVYQ
jgi:hypothetical protein